MHSLRFRQIHLDFHTSPHIPAIGESFNKKHWQETLQRAAVNSITIFAKCHHGWSYHPTKVGKMHPHLSFDLLRAQYEACKEIDINCPIYLSAGIDNLASYEHPEWREVNKDGTYAGWAKRVLDPGFHMMDFHSPYLHYLCEQIHEVVELFPGCDGIFLDIISQNQSCTRWSLEFMDSHGLDAEVEADRIRSSELALEKYYIATTAASRSNREDMPVFHNAGHIPRGKNELLQYFSHLELESLPTGGWGYDHFPSSAKYVCNLEHDFLGMTGKFHNTWGEFGGFKHPNALRYECAAMVAFGSKCSVGDQLHPNGLLDESTYDIIGEAYREVADKEPWCAHAKQIFDIAVLSSEAENHNHRNNHADDGAGRILLEGHFLFALVDRSMDFSQFRALLLPDDIRIDEELKQKLDTFVAEGGKLILSGKSGMWKEREEFAFHLGVTLEGESPFVPDYIAAASEFAPGFVKTPMVMSARSQRIRVSDGTSLGDIHDPYFNRTYKHFCSHQHAPNQIDPSGFHAGVIHGSTLYFAHPVFSYYRTRGAVAVRDFVIKSIKHFLGSDNRITTNLPSNGRVALTSQESENRFLLHALYAPTIKRGGADAEGNGSDVEVIEDLPELHNVTFEIRDLPKISSARLVPQQSDISCEQSGDTLKLTIPSFACHQMVELTE